MCRLARIPCRVHSAVSPLVWPSIRIPIPFACGRGSVWICQAAPKKVKDTQTIEEICIRLDDGYRKNSEDDLVTTMGSAWDVVQDGALEEIRIEEGIPAEAVTMADAVDGALLGMRKEKGAPGQGNAPRPAGFREASSGTISLYDAAGTCLRTVCYGRMPEAGKVSLKGDVVAEAEHCLRLRPDLEVVFIAAGAPDNWSFCKEALLARLAASERGAGHRLRGGIADGVEPVPDAPRDPEGRDGRHRQGHPRAAAPREEASPPEAHHPGAQLLPKAAAPHAICRSPRPRDANRKRCS